ncbi:MAG: TIGR02996 domain-containing protein [Planctomycetales bacterium]
MDMERAFKQEIAANPHDEAPRKLYADWLEERGDDERAAYWREFDASQLYTLVVENYNDPNHPGYGDGGGDGNYDGEGYGFGHGDGNNYGSGDGNGYGCGYTDGGGDGYDIGIGRTDIPREFGKLRILGAADPEESAENKPPASDE